MTRGTIAFIDYDEQTDNYNLFVSNQFNGDMAPDMVNGKKFIRYFKEIYLNEDETVSAVDKMQKIVTLLSKDFGYEVETWANLFKKHVLPKDEHGNVILNLKTKYIDEKNIDYENDPWSSLFGYPDYVYVVLLCEIPVREFGKISIIAENENGMLENHVLEKDYVDVYHFRKYAGHIEPETGTFNGLPEKDDSEEELANEADLENEEETAPLTKYVEIITQYRDNDRDCLVVRTSNNKHVIFKQMN